MNVAYLAPLQRAIARARSMLFQPFRMETWFKLGFAAFLSQWVSGAGSQAGWRRTDPGDDAGSGVREFLSALEWGPIVAGVILLAIVLGLVILWLSSRGRFVFLDDVMRGRDAITEPWRRFARLGNSLFLWRLGFLLVTGLVMSAVIFGTIGTALLGWLRFHEPLVLAPSIVGGVALVVLLGLLIGFVSLLLDEFVVPLMYRHGIPATAAWRRFLPLLRQRLGSFVLYALFVLGLLLVTGTAIMVLGFATCCVGFVLVALPYISHVVLLPIHVTFRGLGPEFLAQYGAEFDALAGPAGDATSPESAPPTGPGPWMPV